jgi:hypothetical protein
VVTFPRAVGAAALAIALIALTSAAAQPHSRVSERAGPVKLQRPGQPVAWPGEVPQAVASPASKNGSVESLNWSGYAVAKSHTTFLNVQATFFVPYLNCRLSPGSASSDWIGMDGFVGKHPKSVQQVGVEADCTSSGHGSYFAWYEMFPRPERRQPITVRAGDAITSVISYNPSTKLFKLMLTDDTTGAKFVVRRPCQQHVSCPRNSAELISESPVNGTQMLPLADYGAVSFAQLSITDGHGQHGALISRHWDFFQITEVSASSGDIVARPTPSQAARFDNYWSRPD